jgi:hypothetical protein
VHAPTALAVRSRDQFGRLAQASVPAEATTPRLVVRGR